MPGRSTTAIVALLHALQCGASKAVNSALTPTYCSEGLPMPTLHRLLRNTRLAGEAIAGGHRAEDRPGFRVPCARCLDHPQPAREADASGAPSADARAFVAIHTAGTRAPIVARTPLYLSNTGSAAAWRCRTVRTRLAPSLRYTLRCPSLP
jgi:hypothetical protein